MFLVVFCLLCRYLLRWWVFLVGVFGGCFGAVAGYLGFCVWCGFDLVDWWLILPVPGFLGSLFSRGVGIIQF